MKRFRLALTLLLAFLTLVVLQAATVVSDSFTGLNNTNLTARTGEVGATWAKQTGATGDLVISTSNRARMGSTMDSAEYYASGTPVSADYSVQVDFYCVAGPVIASNFIWVKGRASTTSYDYYKITYDGNNQAWYLQKADDTVLGSSYSQVLTTGVTYVAKLVMTGTTIEMYIDGVQRTTATDSTYTGTGKAGLGGFTESTNLDTEGIHWDNFIVTDSATAGGGINLRGFPGFIILPWRF